MAVENDVLTMDGLFREVYANEVEGLVPDSDLLAKLIEFVPQEQREGNLYHQPVILTREQGYTLNGASATVGTAFALNAAEAAQSQDAQVQGIEFVLQSAISYGAASRLLKTPEAGRVRAFVQGSQYLVENMIETASFVREVQLLYGQTGIGVVGVANGPATTTTQSYTITDAQWASGIWAGMENGFVDAYDTTLVTKRNAADVQVTLIDVDTKTVTLIGAAADLDAIVATDVFSLRGGIVNDMAGLDKQLTNSGTIFNINAANFSLWKPNSFSANAGPLSFTKLIQALNKPTSRGLKEPFCFIVSPATWTDVMNDLSALRRYTESAGGSLEQGSESLTFYSQSGHIEIKPHIYVKAGEAFGFPPGKAVRVGSDDITFRLPGGNDRFFENLQQNAGYGLRCYFNQAWIFRTPARGVKITGIVNSDPSA